MARATRTNRGAMRMALVAVVLTAAVAGCTPREDRVLFDGLYFPLKSKPVDKKTNRVEFIVTVDDAGQSVEAARQAGGYEGIRYCIANYGTSRIDWIVGPNDEVMPDAKGEMTMQGKCRR